MEPGSVSSEPSSPPRTPGPGEGAPAPAPSEDTTRRVVPPSAEDPTAQPFGELLLRDGLVTPEQLQLAMDLQAEQARRGVFLRLGELLVAHGHLEAETVSRVLSRQGLQIRFCPQCLAQYNVADQGVEGSRCTRCDRLLEDPPALTRISVEDTVGQIPLAEGREFGPYVILGLISRGGMGVIYKARQKSLDRVVAMKVLASPRPGDQVAFAREARAVARLRHPHIVTIHEVGRIGAADYFTMDYIEGAPLDRTIAADGLNEREIIELMVRVCDAVEYAHSEGMLHRDLKPANILVDKKRNPILIDFGIARGTEVDERGGDELVGSPAYLPPEYLSGEGGYGRSGEIYALGATLYTALAGRPPHTGIDTVAILRRAKVEAPVDVRALRRSVDRDLATIVMTALERDPSLSYPSVRELGNDLRRWLEGEEVAGLRGPLGRVWSRIRGRVAAALGLAISLLLLVVSVSFTVQLRALRLEDQNRAEQAERERSALRKQLLSTQLRLATLMVDNGEAAEAEQLLTRVLQLESTSGSSAEVYEIRARARQALGNEAGAEHDRRAASKLSGG
jgi:predicted Ser/Thr protein kinase